LKNDSQSQLPTWVTRAAANPLAFGIVREDSELDLALIEPYLRGVRERARLAGAVDGVLEFTTPAAGEAALEVDLGARGFAASLGEEGARPLAAESLSVRMGLDLSARSLSLRDARIRAGDLDFDLQGAIERPLAEGSPTRMTLGLAELPLDPESTRSLAGWLPEAARERFGLPHEKLYVNIDRFGNTTAATVPICLHELREAGRIGTDELVMFVAFGGGLTWGSSLWRV